MTHGCSCKRLSRDAHTLSILLCSPSGRYDSRVIRFIAGALAATLCLHCTPDSRVPVQIASIAPSAGPEHPLIGYAAHFLITWNGARIGDASESLHAHGADGLRFERRERITVTRGEALAHAETLLIIDTDPALRAHRVTIRQLSSGAIRRGEARRNDQGDWLIRYADEPPRIAHGAATPAELVPLLLAATDRAHKPRRSFEGPVMLAGYGFAIADLQVRPMSARTLLATLSTPGGSLRGQFFLGQSGVIVRIRSDDGSGAQRVDAAAVLEPFTPPEVVESASVPVDLLGNTTGSVASSVESRQPDALPDVLHLGPIPAGRPLPPALPGQRIDVLPNGWQVHLNAGDQGTPPMSSLSTDNEQPEPPPDPTMNRLAARIVADSAHGSAREQAFALARASAQLLEDDLGAPGVGAHSALAQGRGDCTAHALLFSALARERGIPTRLVTGYRFDGARLVRHRWAVVAVDGRWIAVDPTHGEAPATPHLIGLAVHGPRAAELALADDLAFAGLADIRAYACVPPVVNGQPCDPSMPRTR